MFIANFLIGLREGLEASLIVSILVAYLVKTGRRDRLPALWTGVGLAVAFSVAAWAVLTFTSRDMTFHQKEALAGTLSIVAVAFVTWMVFWMRRAARGLKGELHGKLDTAIAVGPAALMAVAFLAVAREGLETTLILWTASQSTAGISPFVGAVAGLAAATGMGYLIYRGALRINLSRFFTITGALLIVVAAGVLAYGIHDLQEAGVLPGGSNLAFDVSSTISPDGWLGTILKGTVNFQPNPTVLQVAAWVAYIVPVMTAFFAGARTRPAAQKRQPARV